jgi:hypothetical protein
MGIWLRTTDNKYEFSCSFTLWDEILTAYVQAFIYFLGDWIEKNNDKHHQDNNDHETLKQYSYFQDIKTLYSELMNIKDNDYDNFVKLTNKYNDAIDDFFVYNGVSILLNINGEQELSPENAFAIITITEQINDYFNAKFDKDIKQLIEFLGNAYSNELTIYVS